MMPFAATSTMCACHRVARCPGRNAHGMREYLPVKSYELYVSPTRDFEQELLWHGRKVIVLSPDDFRQEMTGILKDMVRSYETGENTVEE